MKDVGQISQLEKNICFEKDFCLLAKHLLNNTYLA